MVWSNPLRCVTVEKTSKYAWRTLYHIGQRRTRQDRRWCDHGFDDHKAHPRADSKHVQLFHPVPFAYVHLCDKKGVRTGRVDRELGRLTGKEGTLRREPLQSPANKKHFRFFTPDQFIEVTRSFKIHETRNPL